MKWNYFYAFINKSYQNQPYLLFIGSGELESELKNLVKKFDLERVRFAGFVNQSQLPKFYEICDVFVLPSSAEQWGLVINEVMNHSKPVIVSDQVGCAPDLVENEKNGYIFKCSDINHLESCLQKIIFDEAKIAEMSLLSYKKINTWSFDQDIEALRVAIWRLTQHENYNHM